MGRTIRLGLLLIAVCLIAGCSGKGQASSDPPVPATRVEKPADDASDKYFVKFETTKGDFIVEVNRAWAPRGADRFHELVKGGFYDGCRFFRVARGFMIQFGINGDPEVNLKWLHEKIPDDPVVESNKRGTITFAMGGPNTRTTQVFINFGDNGVRHRLDSTDFAPFGKVIYGMAEVVDKLYDGYGELPNFGGRAPDPRYIMAEGNAFLEKNYPKLDYIKKATIITEAELPKEEPEKKPAEAPAEKKDEGK